MKKNALLGSFAGLGGGNLEPVFVLSITMAVGQSATMAFADMD